MNKRNNFIDRIFENMFREMSSLNSMFNNTEFPQNVEAGKPYFYGYTMEAGPDGQPVVNKFGNIGQSNKTQAISEHRDPTVDVLESKEGNSIKIIADLPGVTKDNIKVTETRELSTLPQRTAIESTTKIFQPERNLTLTNPTQISQTEYWS